MVVTYKVALVTGGTSGIGKATAMALANSGAKVVIAGRRVAEGQAVVEEIGSVGGQARFMKADVAKENEVRNRIDETLKHFGRLDIAFNNAGVDYVGQLTEFSADDYRRTFDVNVRGVFLSMKYEIPTMLKGRWRLDHQHVQRLGPRWDAGDGHLCGQQTCRGRNHQGGSA